MEQRFTLLAAMGENVDWDAVTVEQVQVGIREAKQAGGAMTSLIQNGFRMQIGDFFRKIEPFTIQIPALPRLTEDEVKKHFSWVRDRDSIERDSSIVEAATLELGTVLAENEQSINGSEYESRLGKGPYFGLQHALWLVDHQDDPGLVAFKNFLGKAYIDFPGIVLVDADGIRHFPYLNSDGLRCYLYCCRIDVGLIQFGRVARPCK